MKEVLSMVAGVFDFFVEHTARRPADSRGLLWTILAWVLGLTVLVLVLREPLLTLVVVASNYLMGTIPPPSIKVKRPYKSRR